MPVISGGGGGNTTAQVTASGKVVPAASPAVMTVDSTTYTNPVTGSGKVTALLSPTDTPAIVLGQAGELFPEVIMNTVGSDFLYLSPDLGATDPYAAGVYLSATSDGAGNKLQCARVSPELAKAAVDAPRLNQVSPRFTIASGALPTVQLVSATGAQILTTRDAETVTPCTFNPGAATTATVTVALSPDNVTYSTLAVVTEPAGVALDGTILPINVRVPAGWYLKLTVNAQATLGLTTYY